jgi:outer membrane lipoprotein-sorting protein
MNWKNLSDKLLRFLFLAVFCWGLTPSLYGQGNFFSQLKEKFEQGAIFNADFHHQSIDSYTQDTVASSGKIWVGERRYKVRADNQSVVVDGQTSMVYDENRNRVIISKYEPEEDDFAPSRILNGVDSTFTVKTEEQRDDQIYIRLTSDDSFAIYKDVEIYLSNALVPQKIRAVDPVDNVITTTFRKGEFITSRENMFLLDYPSGAEVVDMRN